MFGDNYFRETPQHEQVSFQRQLIADLIPERHPDGFTDICRLWRF